MADYGVTLLAELASGDDSVLVTSASLATRTGLPEPTVAKVIKQLAKGGILDTQRGAKGGYRLSRSLDEITVTDIITLFDGPIALTTCVEEAPGGESSCRAGQFCRMRGRWERVSLALRATFDQMRISDLIADGGSAKPRLPTNTQQTADQTAEHSPWQ